VILLVDGRSAGSEPVHHQHHPSRDPAFNEDFGGRILPFGAEAARPYARIAAERRRAGRPISQFDAQIAAIALTAGATVATRNLADYEGCGVKLVNPWNAGS
jgi:hypothetical protein